MLQKIKIHLILGLGIAVGIFLLILAFYVLIWVILLGSVLYLAAWIKTKFFPTKPGKKHTAYKTEDGHRVIEHDEIK